MSRLGLYLGVESRQAGGETLELCTIAGVCLFSFAEIRLPSYCSVVLFLLNMFLLYSWFFVSSY